MSGETQTLAGAEAMARRWANKETSPADHMPEVANWATEQAVREMARTGDLHQRQVIAEIQRRKDLVHGGVSNVPRFVDIDPWKGVEGGILVPFGTHVTADGEITDAPAEDDREE